MTKRTINRILRMRSEGYKIWKIAQECGVEERIVAYVLTRAGKIDLNTVEMVVKRERAPTSESTKLKVAAMRASRKGINRNRRIGGGTWSGRE